MSEQLIVSLEAWEGKNPGEAIGTYKRYHIVFLPRGTPVDVTVRVVLEEITTKKDSAGRTMYRGVPAPVEYSDRWKDNGDGTISKITVSKDWLGTDCEEGTIETRQLATREGTPSTRTERQVCWGSTLAACTVDVIDITTIPAEVETVQNGQLGWRKTSEREERSSRTVSVTDVRVSTLDSTVWKASYPPEWQLSVAVDHDGTSISVRVPWSNAPKEVRERIEQSYPVCTCGRQRYDVQNPDGYAKCEKCREEERCVRCCKQAKVTVIGGRLICATCKPYEDQEQLVNRVVTGEQRQALAQQATRLLAGNAVPREAGEAVVQSTLGHVQLEWKRSELIQKHTGYAWYYFCDDGVYGSKFPVAALQILRDLPQATGNGVVELVTWLSGYQKVEDCERYGDFFYRTQVKGEAMTPSLSESSLQSLTVAVKLRGSEADRKIALDEYQSLVERLGEDADQVRAVAEILNSQEQDYATALEKIREASRLLDCADRGELAVNYGGHFRRMGRSGNCDWWVVRPDGSCREPDNVSYRKRYTSEGDKYWRIVEPEELAISWSKGSSAADHYFSVDKLPADGVTPEQLATVARLEQEIEDEWEGASGLSSGKPSPSVGEGWSLHTSSESEAEEDDCDPSDLTRLFGGQAFVKFEKPRESSGKKKRKHNSARQQQQPPEADPEATARGSQDL